MASRRRTPVAHLVRRIAGGAVVAVLASLAVVATPGQASAAPTLAPAVESGDKLEPVIEEYDRVASLLDTDRARAATLDTKVGKLTLQVTAAQAQLRPVVRRAYELGAVPTFRLLFDSATTEILANQMSLSEEFAHQQRERIASLTSTRNKYRATKKDLDVTIAKLATRKADLAAKKRTILAELAEQQRLRQHLPPGELNDPTPFQPVACPYTPIGGAAGVAVAVACAQIGKPYIWAAVGPSSFDCSGLMVYAWGKAGKKLRHYTKWQFADGTPITRSQLRPGDLVFFYPPTMHHVGMYVGGGWMVNAPDTGDHVRMAKIDKYPIGGFRRP